MRPLPIISIIIAAIVGILVGMAIGRAGVRQEVRSRPVESADLGERLMARVGRNFVGDSRRQWPPDIGMTFYSEPKPYGSWLCRVDLVSVPPKIVQGTSDGSDFYDDDIKVFTKYGLWRSPTGPDQSEEAQSAACRAFRKFGTMIYDSTEDSVLRSTYVADVILKQVRVGRPTFPVACVDRRLGSKGRPCDGIQQLRKLLLTDLRGVSTISEKEGPHSYTRVDRLGFRGVRTGKGEEEVVSLRVTDEQVVSRQSADEADVKSVVVELDTIM